MYDVLTKKDVQEIKVLIIRQEMAVRNAVVKAIVAARLNGNLEENEDYLAAKRSIIQSEGRIRYLEKIIYSSTIIEEHPEEDEIDLNTWVEIQYEEQPRIERYKLMDGTKSNLRYNHISIESPIGQAIFKHRVNDRVYVKVNEEDGYYVIIKSIQKDMDSFKKPKQWKKRSWMQAFECEKN